MIHLYLFLHLISKLICELIFLVLTTTKVKGNNFQQSKICKKKNDRLQN